MMPLLSEPVAPTATPDDPVEEGDGRLVYDLQLMGANGVVFRLRGRVDLLTLLHADLLPDAPDVVRRALTQHIVQPALSKLGVHVRNHAPRPAQNTPLLPGESPPEDLEQHPLPPPNLFPSGTAVPPN